MQPQYTQPTYAISNTFTLRSTSIIAFYIIFHCIFFFFWSILSSYSVFMWITKIIFDYLKYVVSVLLFDVRSGFKSSNQLESTCEIFFRVFFNVSLLFSSISATLRTYLFDCFEYSIRKRTEKRKKSFAKASPCCIAHCIHMVL